MNGDAAKSQVHARVLDDKTTSLCCICKTPGTPQDKTGPVAAILCYVLQPSKPFFWMAAVAQDAYSDNLQTGRSAGRTSQDELHVAVRPRPLGENAPMVSHLQPGAGTRAGS